MNHHQTWFTRLGTILLIPTHGFCDFFVICLQSRGGGSLENNHKITKKIVSAKRYGNAPVPAQENVDSVGFFLTLISPTPNWGLRAKKGKIGVSPHRVEALVFE